MVERRIRELRVAKDVPGLRLVHDVDAILTLIRRAISAPARALIREGSSQGQVFGTIEAGRVPAEIVFRPGGAKALPALGQSCFVLLVFPDEALAGFRAQIRAHAADELRLEMPDAIVRIERRKNLRYVVPPAYEIYVEAGGNRFRLLDVSEEGLALYAESDDEARRAPPGARFPQSLLRIQNRSIPLALEVRSQSRIKKSVAGAGIKIGTHFAEIAREDSEFLAEYVILQLAQYSGKNG